VSIDVGLALKAATERAIAHERMCPRKLRVRFMTHWGDYRDGLTIIAGIAVRPREAHMLEKGEHQAKRVIPWADLTERAGELVTLVDEIVQEVEARFEIHAV